MKNNDELDMDRVIPIGCPRHDVYFLMMPSEHLAGAGCPVCDGHLPNALLKKMKRDMKYGKFKFVLEKCDTCAEYTLYYLLTDRNGVSAKFTEEELENLRCPEPGCKTVYVDDPEHVALYFR